jgi:hypothetical protein
MRSHPRDFTPVCTTYVAVPGNTVVIVVVVAVAGVVVPGQLCHSDVTWLLVSCVAASWPRWRRCVEGFVYMNLKGSF